MMKILAQCILMAVLLLQNNPALSKEEWVSYFSTGFLSSKGSSDTKTTSFPLVLSWHYQRFNGSVASSYIGGKDSGWGDTTISIGYELSHRPDLRFSLKQKFATGDKAKGHSSGETDISFQLDYFMPLSDKVSFMNSAGYTLLGKPASQSDGANKNQSGKNINLTIQNIGYASVGTAYRLSKNLNIGLLIDYQQSAYSKLDDQTSLSLFFNQSLNANWDISVLVERDNLQTNSLGVTVTRQF